MTQVQISNYLINDAVDKMAQFLVDDKRVGVGQALDTIYNSKTYKMLQDPETDLYIQSPGYIYQLLSEELQNS